MQDKKVSLLNVRVALLLFVAVLVTVAAMRDWTPTTAQVTPTKIAVIDTEAILLRSKLGKAMTAELRKLQEDTQTQYNAETDRAKREQISQNATTKYNATRDRLMASIDVKMMPTIDAVGKEMKVAAIFRKFESGLIYADDSLDITNTIIQRIDAATP